jgi:hypothetical protein
MARVLRSYVQWYPLTLIGLVACGADFGDNPDNTNEPTPSKTTQQILNGTSCPYARPEVGQIILPTLGGSSCTATLINSFAFTTAAHCINFQDNFIGGQNDAFYVSTGSGQIPYRIARIKSLGKTAAGPSSDANPLNDAAIGYLAQAVPASSVPTPATLWSGYDIPNGTWLTAIGYGATTAYLINDGFHCWINTPPGGDRQAVTFIAQSGLFRASGDSGGPVFLGQLSEHGPTARIHSGYRCGFDLWSLSWNYWNVDAIVPTLWIEDRMRQNYGYEYGMDRPGWDITNFQIGGNLDSALYTCKDACLRNEGCRAFTYKLSDGRCFLKELGAPTTADLNAISGLAAESIGNFDRWGSDLVPGYPVRDWEVCKGDCARNPSCYSYTFNGSCWLKSRIPAAGNSTASLNGRRIPFEWHTDRPYNDLTHVTASRVDDCADQCAGNYFCTTFSYNTSAHQCYLKMGVPAAVNSTSDMYSGVLRGRDYDVDRWGGEGETSEIIGGLGTFNGNQRQYDWSRVCQANCYLRSDCKAWSAHQFDDGRVQCWYKKSIPARSYSPGTVSVLKGAEFF